MDTVQSILNALKIMSMIMKTTITVTVTITDTGMEAVHTTTAT